MQSLDVVTEDVRWDDLNLDELVEGAARAALTHLSLDPDNSELTVLACDDARIAVLNGDFRAKPTPTNVLSWPADERGATADGDMPRVVTPGLDGLIELGDIALSYDTCAAEAVAAGKTLAAHVTHLVVHGVLHLLGYDHVRDRDATLMERLEVEILGKMGHDDPYREHTAP